MAGLLWIVAAMLASLLLITAIYAPPAAARDPDGRYANSPYKEWFNTQHNSKGGYCCNDADGHEYDGDYSFDGEGNVSLTLDGQTVKIEAWKVLHGPNPTGHAVVWYVQGNAGPMTFCFAPGQLT